MEGNKKNMTEEIRNKLLIEISEKEIEKFLFDLISIPSDSKNENEVLLYIEKHLKKNRIRVIRQYVDDVRYNLIAKIGNSKTGKVLFNTHVDTVPAYSRTQLFPYTKNGKIFGRGACDAKGSVAAMIMALLAIKRVKKLKKTSLTLALTVGEENSGDGVARFVKEKIKYDWAVVGEPTDLKIANAQAGYTEIIVKAISEKGHAFAPISDQAPLALVKGITSIFDYISKSKRKGFIQWLNGGESNSFWYTRPTSQASIIINTHPAERPSKLNSEIRGIITKLNKSLKSAKLELVIEDWDRGILLPENLPCIKVLEENLKALRTKAGKIVLPSWTDGSTLFSKRIPTFIFGPGALKDAHTVNEQVKISDVRIAAISLASTIL
ncbi:MAG: M20/M25/M40 family metallo-hydrolase, partial [Bacteroidetes bacterium]|nr:M20/M25/M40 family metallo-hydrolase [Bacteroidota bacterium]